jgi:tetratricopeptide (TPR) repeat protein
MGAINLLRNEHSRCLKNLNDCLKSMGENNTTTGVFYAEVVLLKGDALLAQCDYEEAMKFYDETLKVLLCDPTNNRVEIGIAMYRKGMLHYARGEKEDALKVLGDSIALKGKIGESSANFATAYYFAGHLLADHKRIPEAIDYFEKAIHMMKDNLDEVDNVDIYLTTGKLCELRDEMDGCLDAFDLALKEIRDVPRMEFDRAIQDLRSIASVSMRLGDFVGAIPILDKGLDLTENRPYSLARASLFSDLGLCESKQGDYQESTYHYEQALKIRRKKLGDSELVIETLMKLGETYKMMEKPDDALSFYNDALEVTEKTYGEDNERVASLLYLLGDIKESTKETMEALANFEECLEIRRRNLEITSLLIAETLERIGSIYTEQENLSRAYSCFTEALDIRQASSDPNDPALVESFFRIGVAARKQGDCERSLHFLLDALRIREKHDQQREMCETLLEIGHVHRELADSESARGCYEKCLEMVHEFYGKSDIMAADVLLALGQIHRSNGDTVQALKFLNEGKFWTNAVMIGASSISESETNPAAARVACNDTS